MRFRLLLFILTLFFLWLCKSFLGSEFRIFSPTKTYVSVSYFSKDVSVQTGSISSVFLYLEIEVLLHLVKFENWNNIALFRLQISFKLPKHMNVQLLYSRPYTRFVIKLIANWPWNSFKNTCDERVLPICTCAYEFKKILTEW